MLLRLDTLLLVCHCLREPPITQSSSMFFIFWVTGVFTQHQLLNLSIPTWWTPLPIWVILDDWFLSGAAKCHRCSLLIGDWRVSLFLLEDSISNPISSKSKHRERGVWYDSTIRLSIMIWVTPISILTIAIRYRTRNFQHVTKRR